MSAALEKRKEADQADRALASGPSVEVEGPRRSQRLLTQLDQSRLQAELDQCRAELSARTQGEWRLKALPWLCFDVGEMLTSLFFSAGRADEAQDAARNSRFDRKSDQCCRPQTGGRPKGQCFNCCRHETQDFRFHSLSPPAPQQTLRQLRVGLQKLGAELQSGERACCRNTGGERLRQAITSADEMLAKQVRTWRLKGYNILLGFVV